MALPIVGWTLGGFMWSIATAIVGALANFLLSKLGSVLTAFGLGSLTMYGLNVLLGYIVDDLNYIGEGISYISINSGDGGEQGVRVLELMAYIGFFDAINIILSGFVCAVVLSNARMALGWNPKNNL